MRSPSATTAKAFAEDDLPRIFDPYFTTRRAGTGLGLAIAKNIIDAMGGSIGVTTRQGVGTDFRIELSDAPGDGRRLMMAGSILLADDEEKILKTLGRALRDDGHELVTAANAKDATTTAGRTIVRSVDHRFPDAGSDGH